MFSDTATPDIKSHYAFRIFGKDQEPGRIPVLPTCTQWGGTAWEPGGIHGALEVILTTSFLPSCFWSLDFDDDGTLNREDLSQLVNCLTGEGEDTRLSASEMKQLIDNVSSGAGLAGEQEGKVGLQPEAVPFPDPRRV